jgi:hypothetical protein
MYTLTMNMNVANMENSGLRTLSLDELDYVSGGEIGFWDAVAIGAVTGFFAGLTHTYTWQGAALGALGGGFLGAVTYTITMQLT